MSRWSFFAVTFQVGPDTISKSLHLTFLFGWFIVHGAQRLAQFNVFIAFLRWAVNGFFSHFLTLFPKHCNLARVYVLDNSTKSFPGQRQKQKLQNLSFQSCLESFSFAINYINSFPEQAETMGVDPECCQRDMLYSDWSFENARFVRICGPWIWIDLQVAQQTLRSFVTDEGSLQWFQICRSADPVLTGEDQPLSWICPLEWLLCSTVVFRSKFQPATTGQTDVHTAPNAGAGERV